MIFNGHHPDTIDLIDEETMSEIMVMYGDGLLGGRGIFDALLPITQGLFNYIRPPNSAPYKPTQIFPWIVEYDQDPEAENDKGQSALLAFLTQAPGFSLDLINARR